MNGTLLHVTEQYVDCFVSVFQLEFLAGHNIQKVVTFHTRNLRRAVPALITLKYGQIWVICQFLRLSTIPHAVQCKEGISLVTVLDA